MKSYFLKNFSKQLALFLFLISSTSIKGNFLNAEDFFEESQIDSSTKSEEDKSAFPTNPFQIVEMIRRQNRLNDATNPSDALDDAIRSFNTLEEK